MTKSLTIYAVLLLAGCTEVSSDNWQAAEAFEAAQKLCAPHGGVTVVSSWQSQGTVYMRVYA
jgi:hypothetical protein